MSASLPLLLGLTLVRNGSYLRTLPGMDVARSRIFRKKCSRCRTTYSLLPNDVIPMHSYGLHLISDRISATVRGESLRSREFYERHGLVPDDSEFDQTSWADRLNQQPLRPSHQLFARWNAKFRRGAQAWLQALLFACLLAGCDVKRLLTGDVDFRECPAQLWPLVLAAGLTALLRPDVTELPLARALVLLSCAPSHKSFRVRGRPPPQYGVELNL